MPTRHDIRALCQGTRFKKHSQREGVARVLSVHDRVINLIIQDELLALALPQAGGSSRFLTLSRLPEVVAGDELRLTRNTLHFRKTSIDVRNISVWPGYLPPDTHATLAGHIFADFAEAIEKLAVKPAINVESDHMPYAVLRWLGLGPGLTPAGDDILLGYLAIDNHLGCNRDRTREMHALVAGALGRTTMLSAQLLRNALECDYHETVQRVLAIVCGLSSEHLLTALRRLAAVGASSGTSTIYGMWLALQHRAALEEDTYVSLLQKQCYSKAKNDETRTIHGAQSQRVAAHCCFE